MASVSKAITVYNIYVELFVHVMLRYLAGGLYHDTRVSAGLAKSSIYRGVTQLKTAKN